MLTVGLTLNHGCTMAIIKALRRFVSADLAGAELIRSDCLIIRVV